MNINFEIEANLYKDVYAICEDNGIDVNIAINMFLKKVSKEQSLAFMFSSKNINSDKVNETHLDTNQHTSKCINFSDNFKTRDAVVEANNLLKMTKSRAIRLLASRGNRISNYNTFASKNRSAYNYWANVEFDYLDSNWSLILNDWLNRVIYLFEIPAGSIKESEMVARADKPHIIDLQIMYNDPTFTDNRSGLSFKRYLVDQVEY